MSLLDFNVVPLWAQKNHFQQFKLTAATNVLNKITDTNISLYQTKSSKFITWASDLQTLCQSSSGQWLVSVNIL